LHVSVRNVITSMRLLSAVDWRDFFESVSLVERALRDGTEVANMDFATRNRYRDAVEQLAKGSGLAEEDVARRAVARSAGSGKSAGDVRSDPGYYLISGGRRELERELAYRPTFSERLKRAWVRGADVGYPAAVCLLTLAVLSLPVALTLRLGAGSAAALILGILSIVPASEIAVAVLNLDVTQRLGPRRLPKLALEDGIPAEMATIIVVPTMLVSEEEALSQVEQLEVRFLANSEGFVYFALLSDWVDAPDETLPDDARLLETAQRGIAELNERHGPAPDGSPRFLLFQRRRLWNPSEGRWMGWERKRGKLAELDRLLRGGEDTSFLPGEEPPLTRIRYVVTLDADTRLPRGAVAKMVGAMAHPLNRPVFDESSRRVVDGNGILQPRITPTLPRVGHGTLYERLFSGPRGIDPYAFAVSDVYQDLFGEGIYTGKGIYDVDAFERALSDRVPENTLLSHDLFEGIFARAGLLSDVELFEDFPSQYEVAAARQHRWARGDWQLLPWLAPRVPGASGKAARDALPTMGAWKIVDNLRRSLVAPCSAAALIASGALAGGAPLVWMAFVAGTIAIPRLLPILAGAIPRRRGVAKRNVVGGIAKDLSLAASHFAASLVLLGHQAWLMSDAIVRTLTRVLVTRRRMLEWTTTARTQEGFDLTPLGFVRRNAGAIAVAAAALAVSALLRPSGPAPGAVLLFVAWAASPLVAWALSLPPRDSAREPLSRTDELLFRSTARRTWRFFESYVTEADHFLPPDNFQESPRPVVAHRTSPTNVGISLLSTIAARDLGWIGRTEMTERLEATLTTAASLERFRGHLYNWYDTQTRAPLEPRYVSTVDSGNLVGQLLVVKQACLEAAELDTLPEVVLRGIRDAVQLVRDSAEASRGSFFAARSRRGVRSAIQEVEARLGPLGPSESLAARLAELARLGDELERAVGRPPPGGGEPDGAEELRVWTSALKASVASHRRDLSSDSQDASSDPPAPPRPEAYAEIELALARSAREADTAGELSPALPEGGRPGASRAAEERRSRRNARIRAARAAEPKASRGRRRGGEARVGDGLRVFVRRLAQAVLDRLPRRGRPARLRLLRPARVRGSSHSFLAIARGEVPWSHWFHLGRPLTPVGKGSALVSWSGSMFEYLMPISSWTSPPTACSRSRRASPSGVRCATAASTACRGECPSPATTRATSP
jgi:cyclic beta-1,2-glucan synthetase